MTYTVKKQILITGNPGLTSAEQWYSLGDDYYFGRNGKPSSPKDYVSARACYEHAIHLDARHIASRYSLGCLYEYGLGVATEDPVKAKEYYDSVIALNGKHIPSLYRLGCLYRDGKGVHKNLAKAKEYYEQAAKEGDSDAKKQILIINNSGLTSAEQWHSLGDDYYYGRNGKPSSTEDYVSACVCYEKALKLNPAHKESLSMLGWMHEHGQGTGKNFVKARKYYMQIDGFKIDRMLVKEDGFSLLHSALLEKKSRFVHFLLELAYRQGIRFLVRVLKDTSTHRSYNGWAALHFSAYKDDLFGLVMGYVNQIDDLDLKMSVINQKTENGWINGLETPLTIAMEYRAQLSTVEALINSGADLEARDKHYRTPLLSAAFSGNTSKIETLIRYGASTSAKDESGRDYKALFLVGCASEVDKTESPTIFSKAEKAEKARITASAFSLVNFSTGYSIDMILTTDESGFSLLHSSIADGKSLFSNNISKNILNRVSFLLELAYNQGIDFLIRVLRDDCTAGDYAGWSALHYAVYTTAQGYGVKHPKSDMFNLVMQYVNELPATERRRLVNQKVSERKSSMEMSFWSRIKDVVFPWETPLTIAIHNNSHLTVIEKLLTAGADPNILNMNESPPLLLAADRARADIVTLLIGSGADTSVVTREGLNYKTLLETKIKELPKEVKTETSSGCLIM